MDQAFHQGQVEACCGTFVGGASTEESLVGEGASNHPAQEKEALVLTGQQEAFPVPATAPFFRSLVAINKKTFCLKEINCDRSYRTAYDGISTDLQQHRVCILEGSHFLLNLCLSLFLAIHFFLILPFLWNLSRRHRWNFIICPSLVNILKGRVEDISYIMSIL